MHFLTLLLATASATLSFAAPTPQAAPTSGEDAPEVPPFQVLTCQAGSIEVRSEWNTAFLTSDPTYSHYGERTLSVPLNGCADLSAQINAYDVNAAVEATPYNSLNCTIAGAPWGGEAKLNLLTYEPWFELVDADPVNVTCVPA